MTDPIDAPAPEGGPLIDTDLPKKHAEAYMWGATDDGRASQSRGWQIDDLLWALCKGKEFRPLTEADVTADIHLAWAEREGRPPKNLRKGAVMLDRVVDQLRAINADDLNVPYYAVDRAAEFLERLSAALRDCAESKGSA